MIKKIDQFAEEYNCQETKSRNSIQDSSLKDTNLGKQSKNDLSPDNNPKPIILDNNPLSISKYAEEYPENWKKITEAKENNLIRIEDVEKLINNLLRAGLNGKRNNFLINGEELKQQLKTLNKKGCGTEFDYDIDMPMICGQEWNGKIFYCNKCEKTLGEKHNTQSQKKQAKQVPCDVATTELKASLDNSDNNLIKIEDVEKLIDDIFCEKVNSSWTQDFINRILRGSFPFEAFDFIKFEIKQKFKQQLKTLGEKQ